MGDTLKTGADFATFGSASLLEGVGGSAKSGIEQVTGVTAAARAADEQKKLMNKQKQEEDRKLAEKDDEIARRRLRGGMRSSLIATTPRGVQPLGG